MGPTIADDKKLIPSLLYTLSIKDFLQADDADDNSEVEGDPELVQQFLAELLTPFFTQANTFDAQPVGGPAYMVTGGF